MLPLARPVMVIAVMMVVSLALRPPSQAAEPPAAAAPAQAQLQAQVPGQVDDLWKRRDDPAALAEQKKLLDKGLASAPSDYGLLWRTARYYFWLSDDPNRTREDRAKLGKQGWDIGERAVAVNGNDVAGHFWSASCMGNYALGLGIVRALTQGIQGKFLAHMNQVDRLDPKYSHGSVAVAWGRYYAKLPWPKYDAKKAFAHFKRALEINPNHLRARVFLAELQAEEDQPQEAHRLLQEVLAASADKYDGPEERRAKVLAQRALDKLKADGK